MQTHAYVFMKCLSGCMHATYNTYCNTSLIGHYTTLIEDAMLQLCLDTMEACVEGAGNTDGASSILPCCKSHRSVK